jgi:2',3'-cyclic-nucleotide 2'-phosphodiesterase/3'-nucleotidase
MSWVDIARANNIVNPDLIKAGQQLIIPSGAPAPPPDIVHLVRRGETLFKIAQIYGVSWQDIARYNQIGPPYIIYAGQTLLIPGDV